MLPYPVSNRERALLVALVGLRMALTGGRLLADPLRFWNFEEAYNATVAWYLAHGGLWPELFTLQYRSFCGGCTVVAAAGAPLLALGDRFVLWKLLALAWTAATMVVGFHALDRLVGRAGAWAFVVLLAVPPVGMSDLSLMLWGNHQETALLGVLALLFLGRGHGLATGFVLGFAVWFARTAAYQALVLVPAALLLLPGQRLRVLLGFGAGLALLAVPAADGDAGFYQMHDALGQPPAEMWKRARTLLVPTRTAPRLYAPVTGMAWGAAAWLGAALVAALCALRTPRHAVFPALAVAYGTLYAVTRFPIFLLGARMPINNIRYHSPWAFALTLVVAAGAGAAWARGWRRLAVVLVALPLVADLSAWARVTVWPTDLGALALRATDDTQLVRVAAARLPDAVLTDASRADPRARATLQRMYGLRLGGEVAGGIRGFDDAAARARAVSAAALDGLGQGMVAPCADPAAVNRRLDTLPPAEARRVGHGAAVTLGLCPARGGDVALRVAALRGEVECWLCEAAGGTALAGCAGPEDRDLEALGRCLGAAVQGVDEGAAVLYGAGLHFARPTRTREEAEAVAAAIGEGGAAFLAGTRDPMAGADVPVSAARHRRP